MKDWPDKCVDLVLTDPPYGIGFVYQEKEQESTPEGYSEWIKPIYERMKMLAIKYVAIAQAAKYMRYFWEWYGEKIRIYIACKNFVMLRKTFMNYAYDPWVFCLQKGVDIRKNDEIFRNLDWVICDTAGLRNPNNPEREHPTPKPLSMMIEIIMNFTESTDLILDPFCGSGTTCVAAKMLGRRYIGIDISPEYCKIAEERLTAIDTGVPVKEARQG
ncbi:MAG: site-specific DNA-methyltransferase, partial [Phycisphaerae bacterium]|nr:site-specific DNA-methyltransferase [Phycisphaerae bacterium]